MKIRSLIKALITFGSICTLIGSCGSNNNNGNVTPSGNEGKTSDPETTEPEAVDEEATEGLQYYKRDDGTYAVGAGNAILLSRIVIPEKHKGKDVTSVLCNTFKECLELETLVLPNTIKLFKSTGLPSTLTKIVYAGTYDEFKAIEFTTNWISHLNWSVQAKDKTFNIIDEIKDMDVKINGINSNFAFRRGNSDEITIKVSTNDFGGYTPEIDYKDVTFSIKNPAIASISKKDKFFNLSCLEEGTTDITFLWHSAVKTISIQVSGKMTFQNIIFESKEEELTEMYCTLDPVQNVPTGTTVVYSTEAPVEGVEDYCPGFFESDIKELKFYKAGEYTVYAYLFHKDYESMCISATLTVHPQGYYCVMYVNKGTTKERIIRTTLALSEANYFFRKIDLNAGDKLSFEVSNYPVELKILYSLEGQNLIEPSTNATYSQVTIKQSGCLYITLTTKTSNVFEIYVSFDESNYRDQFGSWGKGGHVYIHINPVEGIDNDDWAVWVWKTSPTRSEGTLWGASEKYLPSTFKATTYGKMKNKDCGKEGEDTHFDEYGHFIIDIDLTKTDICLAKNGEHVDLVESWEHLKDSSIGFLVVQQSSLTSTWSKYTDYEFVANNFATYLVSGKNSYMRIFYNEHNPNAGIALNCYDVEDN